MTETDTPRTLLPADRLKAFTDGVVAIAMTLLILPLMEGVIDLGREGVTVLEYLQEDTGQLISFAMSFVLIASFWVTHHRIYDRVERTSPTLIWITIAWMFTIVWLPVPTAMIGSMPDDAAQKSLYVGTLIAASLVLMITRMYLLRHPELHDISGENLRAGIVSEIVVVVLFAIALTVAITVPAIGYLAMFLMALTAPAIRLVRRLGRGRRSDR
ncbi:TMEM175 family protein [Microbacterium sp. NPDC057650]|uniref:TMEM175 family protein n=1 Tax=unclassified Microbacterium TaxID=2609290 RepID=UPI00366ED8C3